MKVLKLKQFRILPLVALLLLAGCGGQAGRSADPPAPGLAPAALPTLPAPAELATRSTSGAFPRFCRADEYTPGKAQQVSIPVGDSGELNFSPDFPASGTGTGPAWAMYGLDLTGYLGLDQLYVTWTTPPPAADFYMGVANYGSNRWEWSQPGLGSPLSVDLDADHRSPSNIYHVIVLLTGTSDATLQWLRIGGNIPPIVTLDADPAGDTGPFLSTLTATAEDAEGEITKYEFDVEGTGSFVDNGIINETTHMYTAIGVVLPAVRVTDEQGAQSVANVRIGVGWLHSYGGPGYDAAASSATAPGNALFLTGIANSWGEGANEPALIAFDGAGNTLVEKTLGTVDGDQGMDIASNAFGAILISGSVYAGASDFNGFSAYLTPGGLIGWQKTWGTSGDEEVSVGCLDDAGNAYLATEYFNGVTAGFFLQKIDSTGTVQWQKSLSLPDNMSSPRIRLGPAGSLYIAAEVGKDPNPGHDVLLCRLDASQNLLWARRLAADEAFSLGNIHVGDETVYICGGLNVEVGPELGCMLLAVGHDGSLLFQRRLDMGGINSWYSATTNPLTDDILLVGGIENQDIADPTLCGVIGRYSPAGELQFVGAYNQSVTNNDFSGITSLSNGGFYVVGRCKDAVGSWYSPTYTEQTDNFAWNPVTPVVAADSLAVTGFTGVLNDNTVPAPTIDTGGGSSDIFVMRWFEP